MCKIIAIANQKGGVGKTTTTSNLGIGLAKQGKRVFLIDADAQGSLTASLGFTEPDKLEITLANILEKVTLSVQGDTRSEKGEFEHLLRYWTARRLRTTKKIRQISRFGACVPLYTEGINDEEMEPDYGILKHGEGIDLMPGNIELSGLEVSLVNVMSRELVMRSYIGQVRESYDYILIDCMPSLGMITINAFACADSILIPVQAAYLPVKGLEQLNKTIGRVKRQINPRLEIEGILLTMVDSRTNYARDISALLIENYGDKVRFIAVNNGIDSSKQNDNDFTLFLNIMNEYYARDTSKKIKSVFKAKGMSGKHLTGTVIYGYLWDEKREHWLVDEEAAAIVQRIFQWTMEGFGPYQIPQLLKEQKVEIPSVHLARYGEGVNKNKTVKDIYGWGSSAIVNILKKREYLGHTVNFKTRKHFKDKKSHYVDESEWTIFENTHEAIIDQETFDNV